MYREGPDVLWYWENVYYKYHQTSNISHIFISNTIYGSLRCSRSIGCQHQLLQLHLHSRLNAWHQWIGQRQLQDKTRNISVFGCGAFYTRGVTIVLCVYWENTSCICIVSPSWQKYIDLKVPHWKFMVLRTTLYFNCKFQNLRLKYP